MNSPARSEDKQLDAKIMASGLALNQLTAQASALHDAALAVQAELRRAMADYNFELSDRLYDSCKRSWQTHKVIQELQSRLEPGSSEKPVFVIGSKLLYDAFAHLSAIRTEAILYAAGYQYGSYRTVEQLLPLELEESNYGYAKGTVASTGRVLIELEKFGASFTAYFHTHPGKGIDANCPSSIDMANHARLEQGSHRVVGGIFSRDGHLRFFANKMAFDVTITGKEVEHVGPNQFRLTQV